MNEVSCHKFDVDWMRILLLFQSTCILNASQTMSLHVGNMIEIQDPNLCMVFCFNF
jgi:hypothetical protein